jgi:hypothetical protein
MEPPKKDVKGTVVPATLAEVRVFRCSEHNRHTSMLKWFRSDPTKKLRKQYEQKLLEARDLQRKGDIQGFAQKSAEAEAIMQEIERLGRPK